MATIKLQLGRGTKDKVNLKVRISDGRDVALYMKTDIKIDPNIWDSKNETIKKRILINANEKSELLTKIHQIKEYSERAYQKLVDSNDIINSANFAWYYQKELHPQRFDKNDFFMAYDEFIELHNNISWTTQRAFIQNKDNLLRFEKVWQVTKDRKFEISFNTFTSALLQKYYEFIINEYQYIDNPLLQEYYSQLDCRTWRNQRHINTANGRMKKLRAFWRWALNTKRTDKNPFVSYTIPADRYPTPIYLTLEERNKIYALDLSDNDYWDKTRDIFIFQCFIGCRVGDLWKITKENVQDDILTYLPEKTKKTTAKPLIIPLTKTAKEIIDKYKDEDYLIPTPIISQHYYNRAIRSIAKRAGLDRNVVVLNTDGEPEIKPLYETISSHFARKTFAGNIYKQVKDPALVSSMTGHSANSKAFARYRDIDTDIKKEVIKYLE